MAWRCGIPQKSLFAFMPGLQCGCSVQELQRGRGMGATWDRIPMTVRNNWTPTRETLEAFAAIQQNARFPRLIREMFLQSLPEGLCSNKQLS
jgi:hypothetical protein